MRARTRAPAGSPCRYARMAHESSRLLLFALALGLAHLFEGCGQGWSVDEQTEARGDGVLGHWTDLHGAVTGQPDDDLRARAQPNLGTQPRGDDDLALGRRLDDLHDGSLCPDVQRFSSKYNAAPCPSRIPCRCSTSRHTRGFPLANRISRDPSRWRLAVACYARRTSSHSPGQGRETGREGSAFPPDALVAEPERPQHLAGREDPGAPGLRALVPLHGAGALGTDVAQRAKVDRVGVEADDGAVGAELEGVEHGRSGGLRLPRRGGADLLVVLARALAVCRRAQQLLRLPRAPLTRRA